MAKRKEWLDQKREQLVQLLGATGTTIANATTQAHLAAEAKNLAEILKISRQLGIQSTGLRGALNLLK